MELLSAALPNVMFAAGIIAIAIGLGIELKIVPIGNQVGRGGRIGAMTFGILLVSISVFLYIQEKRAATAATPTAVAMPLQPTPPPAAQVAVSQPTVAPPEPTATASVPSVIAVAPTGVAVQPPTTLPEPSGIAVPDVRGMRQKDAETQFKALGLRIEVSPGSCADLGVADNAAPNAKKDAIACQSPEPGTSVVSGTAIKIVLSDPKRKK